MGCRELCSGTWSSPSSSFYTDLGVFSAVYLTYSLSLSSTSYLITKTLPVSLAQLWPASGPSCSWLELSLSNMETSYGIFSLKSPLQFPARKLLPWKTSRDIIPIKILMLDYSYCFWTTFHNSKY